MRSPVRGGFGALGAVAATWALLAALPAAQGRLATSAAALTAYPGFFHARQIAVRQPFEASGALTRLTGTDRPIYVFWRHRPSRSQDVEIRGEFWDLGRLDQSDNRFSSYDFQPVLDESSQGRWPGRDRVFVIVGASAIDSPLPAAPTLRALALAPEEYDGRGVTVRGRFRGRNLYGDVPQALGKGKWDFVLQSADAAVWVTGIRPRGRGFNLDVNARVDTGRWLEVAGTFRHEGSQTWIEARTVALAAEPTETEVEITVPERPREPPPAVIFSAPIPDDSDVERSAPVRIQFSRDMDPKSFQGNVRVAYAAPARPGAVPPAPPAFTLHYSDPTRSLEIRFADPLERFQVVKVELSGAVTAIDGQPLTPWSLTFTTGSLPSASSGAARP